MSNGEIDIYCHIMNETALAYCIDTGVEEVWVPKSVVSQVNEEARGDCTMYIKEWWAIKAGIV